MENQRRAKEQRVIKMSLEKLSRKELKSHMDDPGNIHRDPVTKW